MTEAMPFLQKAILLSYDPRPLAGGILFLHFIALFIVLFALPQH